MIKSPYPWFGGKARIAATIWQALGDCPNYVEPFFGGGATLLQRPNYNDLEHTETVNDLDCNVANFWRCLQGDPEQLAAFADWPVNEADLHARHQWLVNRTWGAESDFRLAMMADPDHCDYKQAGWWVWGICQWIGSGWCDRKQATVPVKGSDNGMGVHRKLPHLGNNGRGETASDRLYDYFAALAERTRRLRVACGDFERVLSNAVCERLGTTGVLLDPPYPSTTNWYASADSPAFRAHQWATDNGSNPKLRIVLCGYEGEHAMPDGWRVFEWKAGKGYQASANTDRTKERLWLSPYCLPVEGEQPCNMSDEARQRWALSMRSQLSIFDALAAPSS